MLHFPECFKEWHTKKNPRSPLREVKRFQSAVRLCGLRLSLHVIAVPETARIFAQEHPYFHEGCIADERVSYS
eukprot:2530474-Rhodomonas_salina.1